MKHILLILSLFASFQIGTAQEQWNDCNSTINVIPAPPYDSLFVLSDPSRAALAKGMANWTPSTSGGGGASYLVYTALLTQSGTSAPVATVLENTLGGTVVWTRESAALFYGTLSGAFTLNKTFLIFQQQGWDDAIQSSLNRVSANVVQFAGIGDGLLTSSAPLYLEIRVYP